MTSNIYCLLALAPILGSLSCASQMPKQNPAGQTKKLVQFTTHGTHDWNPDWSPDGQWIAFESFRSGNREIYIRRVAGGAAIKVTDHPATDALARWSPDGGKLLFVSTRSGSLKLHIVEPFEEGMPVSQLGTEADSLATDIINWSPDGEEVVYCASTEGNWDIWAMAGLGRTRPQNHRQTPARLPPRLVAGRPVDRLQRRHIRRPLRSVGGFRGRR